jgi:hypothetical protein
MTVMDHSLSKNMFQKHTMSVHRLYVNGSDLVLQFIAIGAKIGTNTFSCCIGRASVILVSSSTVSSTATSTASTATVVPSTAHLDRSSGIISMLRLTRIVGDET